MVSSGGSFGANSLQQEIGLGRPWAIREVRITWPGRREADVYPGLRLNQVYWIREGDPSAKLVTPPAVPLRGKASRLGS